MAITNFIPEVWSATLLSSLKKSLVFAGPQTVNRNYEGEISQMGDTVHIVSVSRPTVANYVKDVTTITPETLTDADRTLLIDQCKYFAFEVDDVDMRQSRNGGALMTEAATEAAYAIADGIDQFVAGLYSGVDAGNAIGTTAITTSALAVTGLVNLRTKLTQANVPNEGRYVILPPWYVGLLLQSDLFVRVDASGTSDALRNGHVGRAFGFDVFESNNVTVVTGDDYRVCAGYTGALTFATQINKVEAYRPESAFSDALKGLNLYGAKLVRPDGVATLIASIT
jgi:N4-gp56 family major capsid protein